MLETETEESVEKAQDFSEAEKLLYGDYYNIFKKEQEDRKR